MKEKTKVLVLNNEEVFNRLASLLQDDFEFVQSNGENIDKQKQTTLPETIVIGNESEKELTKILIGFNDQEFDSINKINKKSIDFSSHQKNSNEQKLLNKRTEQNYNNKYKVKPRR